MPFPAYLGLFLEGLTTHFWGLGCPIYCTQPSFFLVAFALLAGWLLGFLSCVGLLWWISGFGLLSVPVPPASFARQSSPSTRAQLLASYLHEPGAFQRARDR